MDATLTTHLTRTCTHEGCCHRMIYYANQLPPPQQAGEVRKPGVWVCIADPHHYLAAPQGPSSAQPQVTPSVASVPAAPDEEVHDFERHLHFDA